MQTPITITCAAEDILENPKELGRVTAAIAQSPEDKPDFLAMSAENPDEIPKAEERINKALEEVSSRHYIHKWWISNGIPARDPQFHVFMINYDWVKGGKKFRDKDGRFLEFAPSES